MKMTLTQKQKQELGMSVMLLWSPNPGDSRQPIHWSV